MALKLPDEVVRTTSPHLFYKKFPHRINFSVKEGFYWSSKYESDWNSVRAFNVEQSKVIDKIIKLWDKGTYRTRVDFSSTTYFLETEEQIQAIVDAAVKFRKSYEKKNPKSYANGKSIINLSTMTTEQANDSLNDAKIEYRKTKFHGKWTWKIENVMAKKDVSDLETVQAQLFDADLLEQYTSSHGPFITRNWHPTISSNRARVSFSTTWRESKMMVYLEDEDDVAMVRLMISGKTKLSKCVLVTPQ
jgi:hypothetical protein